MSSMKATHSAATPAARRRRAARRCAARPPGARPAAAAPRRCSASAAGTRSFSACAPRLPPTTSRRSGPLRPAKRCAGGGSAHDRVAQRIADPLDASRACPRSACGKPSRMRSAPCASTRLASPATAFESCSTSGLARGGAHEPAGERREAAEAQHDVRRAPAHDRGAPRGTRPAAHRARAAASAGPCRARRGTRRPRTRRRAAARASPPCRRACRARTRARRARRSLAATASPGNTWPPVPPVVIITRRRVIR